MRHFRRLLRRFTRLSPCGRAVLCAFALIGVTSCRNSDSGGSIKQSDPILGSSRIPPQALPLPGEEPREKKDPLFLARNSSDGRPPYRPSRETANGALAGRIPPDDDTLSMGDDRPLAEVMPRSQGAVPLRKPGASSNLSYESLVEELKRYSADIHPPVRKDSGYLVQADVPIQGSDGPQRRYQGVGDSPVDALNEILQQVRDDYRN